MISNFASEWRAAEPDMDAELGERFRYLPRAAPLNGSVPDVNARTVADGSRGSPFFVGRFNESSDKVHPQGRGKPSSDVHAFRGTQPLLCLSSIEARRLRLALAGEPQVNDQIWREQANEFFRVEDPQKLDLGMMEIVLCRLPSGN